MNIKELAALPKTYKKLKFLVVDDFESFRMSVKQMLRAFGAEHIDVCSNGKDAVQKCTFERYDIVLCDHNMGEGQTGQQVLEELRFNKRLKHTSLFILVTAETSKEIVIGTKECQPDGYIAKPITKAVLQKRMDSLILQREALLPINRELDLENYPKAITLCTQEIKKGSRYHNWCHKTLAHLYYKAGDLQHAQKIYEDILNKREIAWARLGLGKVQMGQQKYPDAIDQFKKVITDNQDYVEAYDLLSEAYEKVGKRKEAQVILQQAASISPLAIPRQQHLGELATANQDMEGAISAFKAAVKHSNHSVHDSADNYLNLGRSLCDSSELGDPEKSKEHAEEAINILDKAARKYASDDVTASASLIEARVHKGQDNEAASQAAFTIAESLIDESTVNAETGVEFAKTLYRLGKTDRAEKVLHSLAQRFEDDPSIINSIEELLDEPVSLRQKMKARELNKKGISLFEEGALAKAIDTFKEALKETPKHPALNLNLVQVALKSLEGKAPGNSEIAFLNQTLDNVKHIPSQHRQYKRFVSLSKKVAALSDRVNSHTS
ncbi:tetratricopeptide repeat-containing response regulator [Alkalimarinus coralli]|uniref:tetratricopeptide repeat-containing response regulator n=1 Tax=Alkalimarinus coralli TaxID=2935863 RepID=UPI00202B9CF4|nr:tetratricopeptide repeat-containing response regulator [Alkalimarinus coralli]